MLRTTRQVAGGILEPGSTMKILCQLEVLIMLNQPGSALNQYVFNLQSRERVGLFC